MNAQAKSTKPTLDKAKPVAKPKPEASAAQAPAPAEPKTTKLDTIIALIQQPEGASLRDLMTATGWQKHSVQGAIAGLVARKLGAKVISEKIEGVRRYRAPKADSAA